MDKSATYAVIFTQLRAILASHAARLRVLHDTPDTYYLLGAPTANYPDGMFFGMVGIKKNYVSYHLMALYAEPALLVGMSAGLRKRMQGKSCFNFTAMDALLFAELAELTERALAGYERRGWLLHSSEPR